MDEPTSRGALALLEGADPDLAGRLSSMPNEDIITALDGIPGVRLWTVNVVPIFNLGRPDVVPATDLASGGRPSRPTDATGWRNPPWFVTEHGSGSLTPASPRSTCGTPSA